MRRLLVPILLFLASFFPAWWLAASIARSGPAIVTAWRDHRDLAVVRVGVGGLEVAAEGGTGRGRRATDWLTPAAGLAVLLLLGRWPVGGLFAACLGSAAARNPFLWLAFGGLAGNSLRIAGLAVSVAICFLGLRRMLTAVSRPGRLDRLILLGAGFGLPVALIEGGRLPLLISVVVVVLAAAVVPALGAARTATWRHVAAALCLTFLLTAGIYQAQAKPAADAHAIPGAGAVFFQHGINLTAEFPDGYDSRRVPALLDSLKSYGVDTVALVPYGFSGPGTGTVQYGGNNTMEGDDGIAAVAAQAHQRGMRVFLKPQIWAGRSFPGDLDYPDAAPRARWFAAYGGFVDHYAALATRIHADLFAVGVEFVKLSQYDAEWRVLIARARKLYTGPVTYAANFGPEFETVKFWDGLDYIGLNNYYPLPDDLRTEEVVAKVAAVQKRFGKPVIFPEAGYPSVEGSHREPWAEPRRAVSLEAQSRCYEALYRAFYTQPWFQGMYWWKVGTNGFGGPEDGSHTPWRKPAMDTVKRWYREGGR